MREEYLETEEYENYQTLVTQTDEAVKQEETSTTADEKLTFEEYFPPLHPTDFDCHSDDAMLRKLLKKFQMIFLYPFFKGECKCLFWFCLEKMEMNQAAFTDG